MNASIVTEHGTLTVTLTVVPFEGNTIWHQFPGQDSPFCYKVYEVRWDFTVKKPPALIIYASRDLPK